MIMGNATFWDIIGIVVAALQMLFGVYIVRAFVLWGTIYSVQSVRRAGARNRKRLSGAECHCLFVFNCIGQMVVQVLMIIAIGAKFYSEFEGYYNDSQRANTFSTSVPLIYIIAYGYCAPFLGIFMFLLVSFFWIQKFPIKYLLTILKTLKQHRKQLSTSTNSFEKRFDDFMKGIDFKNLNEDYKKWKKVDCMHRFAYPFASPLLVISSFVHCAALTIYTRD